MTVLKIWLREPHQTDDEAIKLSLDETSDVSDVLLKAPELLRVQHLKPSEIQAEFKDVVLSNRAAICEIFEGLNEGTIVIRPRPGVNIPQISVKEKAEDTSERLSGRISSANRLRNQPPPSPRNHAMRMSPRVHPDAAIQNGSRCSKPPVVKSSSRGPTPTRGSTPTRRLTPKRGTDMGTPRGRQRPASSGFRNDQTASSVRAPTPKRDHLLTPRNSDVKNVPSRFRQEAERVKTVSKKNQSNPVCSSFKPQWGKPLCAMCNHSKQAHWTAQREKSTQGNSLVDQSSDKSFVNDAHGTQTRSPDIKQFVSVDERKEASINGEDG